MNFNWFSPVPPASTDIAHYTARVLPALRERSEVTVYTTQQKCDDKTGVRRYRYDACDWEHLNAADVNFYNIGNNSDFHSEIWEVSRKHAGVIILHDYALQHLFAGYFVGELKSPNLYVEAMKSCYGEAGLEAASSLLGGRSDTEAVAAIFPLTALAIQDALGIVVHTRQAFEALADMSLAPVYYAPLPYEPSSIAVQNQWQQTRGMRRDARTHLVVFGFLGPNRRLGSILEALAGMQECDEFVLNVYGRVWDASHLKKDINRHGLQGIVHLHGYIEDLDSVLANADLAINLRYPTMGEASGTQLRIWDHSLPSLVTATGWYNTLSREAVVTVSPDNEVADIRQHLRSFLFNRSRFQNMGTRGHEVLLRDHSPATYASTIVEVASEAARFSSTAAWLRVADRTGVVLGSWLPGEQPDYVSTIANTISSLAAPPVR